MQTPPFPPMYHMQTPPPRKRKWPWIVLFVSLISLLICGIASIISISSTSTTQTVTQSDIPTTFATSQPTHALSWKTTQTFNGSGSKKTGTFAVPADWKLIWTCNPASFSGGQYNMIAIVYNAADNTMADAGVNVICKAGTIQGETEIRSAGQVYLDVTSEGQWTIKIQEQKG